MADREEALLSLTVFRDDNEGLLFVQKMMQVKYQKLESDLERLGKGSTDLSDELMKTKEEYYNFR